MMHRKEFIKTCGLACLSLAGLPQVLSSCSGTKYIQGQVSEQKIRVAKTDLFEGQDPSKKKARRYVIVKAETMDYPIVLYRGHEHGFTALLLRCTHQYVELNVSGDLITCSAHGSEFNNKGEVIQGPAEQELKRYPVTDETEHIIIHLT